MESATVGGRGRLQSMSELCESGAAEGTRTPDPIITNDVLYQLSYSGPVERGYSTPIRLRKGLFFGLFEARILYDLGICDLGIASLCRVGNVLGSGRCVIRSGPDDQRQHLDAGG